ncbi:hypothetical protein F5Y07DRAFT_393268 [Xylaria sp. FL0933]|nr:hypothetical protein F5Y07DRAFT_393268 [Xylaria sp. FL0933]
MRGPTAWKPSHVAVTTKHIRVADSTLPSDYRKFRARKGDDHIVKQWAEKQSHKAYTFREAGDQFAGLPGEPWWMSYGYQQEQFVNRVKGRETQAWISYEDSINNMKMVDMANEKSGLGPRPSGAFKAG